MFKKLLHIFLLLNLFFTLDSILVAQSGMKCDYCGKEITSEYITYNGKIYHPACLEKVMPKCQVCGEKLVGNYIEAGGKLYHEKCYLQSVAIKCDICGKPILGEYRLDFWGLKYHIEHEKDYPRCAYCKRLISQNTTGGGRIYNDGRQICNICCKDAVFNENEAQEIFTEMAQFLSPKGISLNISQLPLKLVDINGLAKVSGVAHPSELGFTKYSEWKIFGQEALQKNSIYVLSGLPRRTFEGVLAHELMHVWINLNAKQKTNDVLCEGSANYASFLIYSRYNDRIAEYHIRNLREDPDLIYGNGFRKVEQYVERNGLNALLKYLQNHDEMWQ